MRRLPAAAAHVFPYVPTQILMPTGCWGESACGGADVAYVFSQTEGGRVQFLALNYSGSVAAEAQLVSLTTELPFLKDEPATTAFGAARAGDGSVVVYSGACDGAAGEVWMYTTSVGGEWSRRRTTARMTTTTTTTTTTTAAAPAATTTISRDGADAGRQAGGPSFLGGTIAFSARLAPVMDQPTIYTYGGMCLAPEANATGWQSRANYTTGMMGLAPVDSRAADTAYSLRVVSAAGPRTPLAGFTLTQLPASTTNMSGLVTQQADFVLLGGHTQQAFINMSTAAVWSLPERSWSYVDIAGPDASATAAAGMKRRRTWRP
ncbi:hypothetical protein E4U53_003538, partial [Claviceps sorghi]